MTEQGGLVELGATTEDQFELICKVVKKPLSYRDHQSRGKEWNETAQVILLVPETTTESSAFFTAWLPDEGATKIDENGKTVVDYAEVGMRGSYPVSGFFRGALYRANHLLPQPHIFVMSKRVEDLLQHCVGKKIRLTVLGEKEFDEAYEAKAETKSPYSDVP